jgi:hypothetical protein
MRWLAVLVLAVGCATTPSDPELQAERDRLANEVVQAKFWLDEYRKRYGERAGGAIYVGTVRIESVSTHAAAAIFDTRFHGPGAPPKRGDFAYPSGR